MQYWLIKSEADCYSIDDLKRDKTTAWTEIRNYQARNFMREMNLGDKVLFYHSNGGVDTGVAGEASVSKTVFPDPTQFDKKSDYFDSKSTKSNPRWECVEVKYVQKFKEPVRLSSLKNDSFFKTMRVVQTGNRLSVTPVDKKHFDRIVKVGKS